MKHKTNTTKRETPIQGGDTRPDENITGEPLKSSPLATDKSKLTKERAADTNSLEDYKDAKQQ